MQHKVEIRKIGEVFHHPKADRLEIVKLENSAYEFVSRKNSFKKGDISLFIPEGSILPEWMIEESGLRNMLAGKKQNRVRVSKVRGHFSHGILKPLEEGGTLSRPSETGREYLKGRFKYNYAEWLGITKYIPEIPTRFDGNVAPLMDVRFPSFDVQDYQEDISLLEGKTLDVVEKLNGTCCLLLHHEGKSYTTSKGHSHENLYYCGEESLYVKTVSPLKDNLLLMGKDILNLLGIRTDTFCILGEIIGNKIQDNYYGLDRHQFVLFDFIYYEEFWKRIPYPLLMRESVVRSIVHAPFLCRIDYESPEQIENICSKDSIQCNEKKGMEGVILRDAYPDIVCHPPIVGLMVKAVSPNYQVKKTGEEIS